MKNKKAAFLIVCAAVVAIATAVMLSPNRPNLAPAEPVRTVVASEPDPSDDYWARLATLNQHTRALDIQIASLEQNDKKFDGPEYNPCLADAQGGKGRCVSEQASELESLRKLLTDAILAERDALKSTERFQTSLIAQQKSESAHGGDVLATSNKLQEVAMQRAGIRKALLLSESKLDIADTKYIQAMLSGEVVKSTEPLQSVPEPIRDPEKMHRCVETIATARTYILPTAPAGSGSLSYEERSSTPGYWEEGQRVASDWVKINANETAACGFGVSLWR